MNSNNIILLLGSSIIRRWKFSIPPTCKKRTFTVVNRGIDGIVTKNLIDEYDTYTKIQGEPEYIIMYCGGNDVRKRINNEEIITNYTRILELLQTTFPSSRILIFSLIFSPIMMGEFTINIEKINEELEIYTRKREHVTFVDLSFDLCGSKYFYSDGIHVKTNGYRKLTRILKQIILLGTVRTYG
jgi:lysophospholipase L1-like esterase